MLIKQSSLQHQGGHESDDPNPMELDVLTFGRPAFTTIFTPIQLTNHALENIINAKKNNSLHCGDALIIVRFLSQPCKSSWSSGRMGKKRSTIAGVYSATVTESDSYRCYFFLR